MTIDPLWTPTPATTDPLASSHLPTAMTSDAERDEAAPGFLDALTRIYGDLTPLADVLAMLGLGGAR